MEIICPFCPLRCRQLPIHTELDAGTQTAVAGGDQNEITLAQDLNDFCGLLSRRLTAVCGAKEGAAVSETLQAFRRWLASDPQWRPHVSIEGTFLDVQTVRAAIRLAASLDGYIDAAVEYSERCVNEVLEREGYIGATLGEVAERADSVLLLGPVEQRWPRLSQFWNDSRDAKRIFRIPASDSGMGPESIGQLLENLHGHLHHGHLHHGHLRRGVAENPGSGSTDHLANWLAQAHYLAVMWAGDALDLSSASALVRLVQLMNQFQHRAVLVPISEAATFRTTAAWLTGLGGPLRFRSGLPEIVEHSNISGSPMTMVPDIRIWLHPFPDSPAPPTDGAKLVLIGAVDPVLAERADYYFRTTMPGIEANGTTFRGDGTVALPLTKWRSNDYPHASGILQELAAIW